MLLLLTPIFVAGQYSSTSSNAEFQRIVKILGSEDARAADEAVTSCKPKELGSACIAFRGVSYGIKKDLQKAVAELQLIELDRYWDKKFAYEDPKNAAFFPLIQQYVKPYYDYLEGFWATGSKDLKLARQKYLAATAAVPQFHTAWYRLSGIQLSEKSYPAALESINKALQHGPPDRGYLIHRVKIYMAVGNKQSMSKALIDAKDAIAKDKNYGYLGKLYLVELDAPQEIPSIRDLREHCGGKKEIDAGILCYTQAIKYGPNGSATGSVPYWYMYTERARLFEKKERWAEAAADFKKYVEIATEKKDRDGRTMQYAVDGAARNSARAKKN